MLGTEAVKAARRARKGEVEADAGRAPSMRPRIVDEAFLDRTARLFEARTGRPASAEDARQIVENLGGFFRILAEWDRVDRDK